MNNGIAYLSNDEEYTIFQYEERVIRFKCPYSLEHYSAISRWDNGYLVVMAKYLHNDCDEEEYIDLRTILEDLYIDAETFLKPIEEVKLLYA